MNRPPPFQNPLADVLGTLRDTASSLQPDFSVAGRLATFLPGEKARCRQEGTGVISALDASHHGSPLPPGPWGIIQAMTALSVGPYNTAWGGNSTQTQGCRSPEHRCEFIVPPSLILGLLVAKIFSMLVLRNFFGRVLEGRTGAKLLLICLGIKVYACATAAASVAAVTARGVSAWTALQSLIPATPANAPAVADGMIPLTVKQFSNMARLAVPLRPTVRRLEGMGALY